MISISAGDIDMYLWSLDTATDKQAARDNPGINIKEAFSGYRGIIVNPVAPSDGTFNPFTLQAIREAQHWAYDRDLIVAEIAGGFAVPATAAHFSLEPEYLRDAAFFDALETQYSYDPVRANAQVDDAMSRVPGANHDAATNKWLMNGNEIEVIIVQRVEDIRFEIGTYVASVVESWGFTPMLDPLEFGQALSKVYFSDAKLGQWHMYTEGWARVGFVQFDDTQANFFYNGDFGIRLWEDYTPPATLAAACQTLNDGLYVTPDERRNLMRTCVTEGVRDGVRSFLIADSDMYAYSDALSNTVFDLFSGNLQPFALRTTIRNEAPGGTLRIAQSRLPEFGWNAYGGSRDLSLHDLGTWTHPHTGLVIPVRTAFTVNNVGPLGAHEVPASALTFDTATNTFKNVTGGLTSGAYVDYELTFGEWHHGEAMTMADVVATIAMLSRIADGDLGLANPGIGTFPYLSRWVSSFRGFEILDADSIRIWYDTYNPDETLIASRADVFPPYPWELNALITESVLGNETALDATSARLLGIDPLDLAKGVTLSFFDPRLAANGAANTIPAHLMLWVTPAEAAARWAALDAWRNKPSGCIDGPSTWSCNYLVSNGPYFLDRYFTEPGGFQYTAKRTGYPLEQSTWDFLGPIRVPTVAFGTPPEVIQTFPATFQFTTTLAGDPYDRLATATWLLLDPATKSVLFSGEAARSGPGTWKIELTPDETTALVEGTYELKTIVVGEEAVLPIVNTHSFTSLSLRSAVLIEVTRVMEDALSGLRDTLEDGLAATQASLDSVNAATSLINLALLMAVAAIVTATVTVGTLWLVWHRAQRK